MYFVRARGSIVDIAILSVWTTTKKILTLSLALGVSAAALADIDHSQLVNKPGAGTGTIAGANLSMLEPASGETTYGNSAASSGPFVLADDFTVGAGGLKVTGLTFYSYLTGSTTTSVTGINYAIGAAPSTTLTAATTFATTFTSMGGQAVYRVSDGDTTNAGGIRRIQQTDITGLNITLTPGTYFLSFSITGPSFSPPLPSSLAVYGKNAQQSAAGAAFVPALQGTAPNTIGTDMAFIVRTAPVPEPTTMAALGLGALALIRKRRK